MTRTHHLLGEFELQDGSLIDRESAVPDGNEQPVAKIELLIALQERIKATGAAELRTRNLKITRRQLRESVTPDLSIINAISTIEELDKVINALSKRLREWYALHDPETERKHSDHESFVNAVLTEHERVADTAGGKLSADAIAAIMKQATAIKTLQEQRTALLTYLEAAMTELAPNLARVAGPMIGAKLIALAGSLLRLSTMPSGTIQLLGAETALFRHLRNPRARPPKHGIIFNHVLLQRAPKEGRGRAARAIADAIAISAKIDRFKGEYAGDTLYAKIERAIADRKVRSQGVSRGR